MNNDLILNEDEHGYLEKALSILGGKAHTLAARNGFWEDEETLDVFVPTEDEQSTRIQRARALLRSLTTMTQLALITTEVSEAIEGLRTDNVSDKIGPRFSAVEEELADVVIRVCQLADRRGYDLSGAIAAKHRYNTTRPRKHGGKNC